MKGTIPAVAPVVAVDAVFAVATARSPGQQALMIRTITRHSAGGRRSCDVMMRWKVQANSGFNRAAGACRGNQVADGPLVRRGAEDLAVIRLGAPEWLRVQPLGRAIERGLRSRSNTIV